MLTRSFDSFSAAAEENGQSRIYLGIHWSFDKTEGIRLGNSVADYVFTAVQMPQELGAESGLVEFYRGVSVAHGQHGRDLSHQSPPS